MRKGKTSPSPSQGGGANLLPLGEIREGFLCLLFGLLLVGCNSRQQQAHEVTSDFDKAKEEQAIRQMVDDVYKEVNIRWDKSSDRTELEGTLEDNYTTEEWQKLFLDLCAIEAEKVAAGNPDGRYFSEDGNVWTMGSTACPFTTEVVRVEFASDKAADVYFWLKPAESENQTESDTLEVNKGIPILWEMRKVGDRWLIQNFIQGDVNYNEYEYNYMEHIKDYIKRNQ